MAGRRNRRAGRKNGGKKARKFFVRAIAAGALLALPALLAWNQTLSYLQGDSFRHWLEGRLSEQTGTQVLLAENMVIEGSRVRQTLVEADGQGQLRRGTAERLSMEVERLALLRRVLHINKLTMEEGALSVQLPQAAAPGQQNSTAPRPPRKGDGKRNKQQPAGTTAAAQSAGFFSLQGIQLDALECKNTDFTLLTGQEGSNYTLQGTTLTAAPEPNAPHHWRATLENGHVTTPFSFLKNFSLKHANVLYDGRDSYTVPECRFMLTPGEIRLQAHLNQAENRWSADIAVNKANVHRLLSDDWKKRLHGELYGKLLLTAEGGMIRKGSGSLSLQQGTLEGLPILSDLKLQNTYPYRTLITEKANCRISFPYTEKRLNIENAWMFDNIDVRTKGGDLRITGYVLIGQGGELGGTLVLGIPQKYLPELAVPSDITARLFNGHGDAGYAWLNINLSGTIQDPQEDLSVRLTTLISAAVPQAAEQLLQAGTGAAAELLNSVLNKGIAPKNAPAPNNAGEETPTPQQPAEGVINAAGNLLKTGLESLF